MNVQEFLRLIDKLGQCPQTLSKPLQALWYDKKGNWHQAHEIVQSLSDADSAWVHAYLHRKEGDINNARYWYHRSSQSEFIGELQQEWEHITSQLLQKANITHGC